MFLDPIFFQYSVHARLTILAGARGRDIILLWGLGDEIQIQAFDVRMQDVVQASHQGVARSVVSNHKTQRYGMQIHCI